MASVAQAQKRIDAIGKNRAALTSSASTGVARAKWFNEKISQFIKLRAEDRLKVATLFLKDKVVENISRPVTFSISSVGRTIVTGRSLPGEYPRAETTGLMSTIQWEVEEVSPGVFEGYVGTPLIYGAILELSQRLQRGYLRRTLNEQTEVIKGILLEPFEVSSGGVE